MQIQRDFYHIKRKDHRDKNLWHFFFAIFAIFVVKFLWLRLAALGDLHLFAANHLKCLSMNHLHTKPAFPSQPLVKPSQAQSNHKWKLDAKNQTPLTSRLVLNTEH